MLTEFTQERLRKEGADMTEEKKCQEPGCSGVLDASAFVILQAGGCAISSMGYPCDICSRLHKWDGPELIFNDRGQKLFRKVERGKALIECRDANNIPILAVTAVGDGL